MSPEELEEKKKQTDSTGLLWDSGFALFPFLSSQGESDANGQGTSDGWVLAKHLCHPWLGLCRHKKSCSRDSHRAGVTAFWLSGGSPGLYTAYIYLHFPLKNNFQRDIVSCKKMFPWGKHRSQLFSGAVWCLWVMNDSTHPRNTTITLPGCRCEIYWATPFLFLENGPRKPIFLSGPGRCECLEGFGWATLVGIWVHEGKCKALFAQCGRRKVPSLLPGSDMFLLYCILYLTTDCLLIVHSPYAHLCYTWVAGAIRSLKSCHCLGGGRYHSL